MALVLSITKDWEFRSSSLFPQMLAFLLPIYFVSSYSVVVNTYDFGFETLFLFQKTV